MTPRALPRFFVSPAVIEARLLPDDVAHQVRHVLRLKAGDWICLLNGVGGVYRAQLGEGAQITSLQPAALETELPVAVAVLQSLVRPEKAETVIRLCVQGGAQAIHFARSERSLVKWEPSKQRRYAERWQKIAREEAELACRAGCLRCALRTTGARRSRACRAPCSCWMSGKARCLSNNAAAACRCPTR